MAVYLENADTYGRANRKVVCCYRDLQCSVASYVWQQITKCTILLFCAVACDGGLSVLSALLLRNVV